MSDLLLAVSVLGLNRWTQAATADVCQKTADMEICVHPI